jgi:hypothetical protein
MYTGKNLPMRAKESRKKKFDAAYGTNFRISKRFQRTNQKRHINFYLELGRLKFEKPLAHVQKVLI